MDETNTTGLNCRQGREVMVIKYGWRSNRKVDDRAFMHCSSGVRLA
jgi:hypothetical protein